MSIRLKLGSLFGRKVATPSRLAPTEASSVLDLFDPRARPSGSNDREDLPHFHITAADQLANRGANPLLDVRARLRNAFTPSQPVTNPRMFAGRTAMLTDMISAIEDQQLHLVLYGERGIGKTSLLHALSQAAAEARYIVIYSSCGAASTFSETFRAVASEIPLLFHSGFAPAAAESGSSLSDLLPQSRIHPRTFGDLCAKLTDTRVIVMLDEFDRAESREFRSELAELIKILSDRSVRLQLVIAGVAADLAELVEHIPSIRRNILALRVPQMSEEELRRLVANGEAISGISFDPTARDLVVATAHGSPYIGSLLCHHSALAAIEEGRLTVHTSDILAAVEQSLSELRDRIPNQTRHRLDQLLGGVQRKLLIMIADASLGASGDFTAADIAAVAAQQADAVACMKLLESLVAETGFVSAKDDVDGRHFMFVEDGVPPYIWFLGVQESCRDGRAPQRARRA